METAKTKRTDVMLVDPRNIIANEDNVRTDMGGIEELSASIVEQGLQVPLKARKLRGEDKFKLVDGHRRLTAIMMAIENGHAIKYVEVLPFKGNKEDELFSMIITGTGQKPLTDIEQAEAIKRLTNFGYTVEEISGKIGKSTPQVYNLMMLANVSKVIKNKVQEGLISGNTVVQIVREVKDPEEQTKMVDKAIKEAQTTSKGKKKKATAKHVKGLKKKSFKQKFMEALSDLNESGVENDKVEFLTDVFNALNDGSVEDVTNLCK